MLSRLLALLSASALSAAPLPFVTEPAFTAVSLEQPIAIVSAPGETNRLFVVEKPGRIIVIDDLAHPVRRVFLDLTERIGDSSSEQGLLALAFHPDFAHNRQFYVWYVSCHGSGPQLVREDRLSRFVATVQDPNRADPASEQALIAQADGASDHNGGDLAFGRDGYLYLSVGDEGAASAGFHNSQLIDKNFFSGILRLDVDRRPGNLAPNPHPATRASAYSVPADNPFVGAKSFNGLPVNPANVRTEFWAVGLRNPFRISFDPATGQLWCADVGQESHEEIDVIVHGGNYGWDFREGAFPVRHDAPAAAKLIDPVWNYPRSEGVSVTGGLVYRGKSYPSLVGRYLFTDYLSGHVWALQPNGEKSVSADRVTTIASAKNIVGFGLDPSTSEVLLANITESHLLRLVPNPAATEP